MGRLNVPAESAEGVEDGGDVMADLRSSNSTAFFDLKHSMADEWYKARRGAVDYGIVLITDENQALQLADALESKGHGYVNVRSYEEWMAYRKEKLAQAGL